MKILLIIVFFSVSALSQSVVYDKFKDSTMVSFKDGYINGSKTSKSDISAIQFRAWARHQGEKVAGAVEYFLTFDAKCIRRCSFLAANNLIFIADKEAINLGEADRNTTSGKYGFTETLSYRATREQFDKLALAKSLEMQLGAFEAVVSDKQKRGIKSILDRTTP